MLNAVFKRRINQKYDKEEYDKIAGLFQEAKKNGKVRHWSHLGYEGDCFVCGEYVYVISGQYIDIHINVTGGDTE